MGVKWFCDVTGKEVFMNPKTEPVKDSEGKPVMTTLKQQDSSGKIKVTNVPKVKYLQEKAFLVRLSVGDETIQRTLSAEAIGPMREELAVLWKKLESLG
jgi:hypothetical protein